MTAWSPAARGLVFLGALNLALAVALAAASSHALKAALLAHDPAGWFQTARHFHELHGLGLLLIGLAAAQRPTSRWIVAAGVLIFAGILLFCGSLYLRSLFGIDAVRALTPLGGIAFMLGWLALAIGALVGHSQDVR